MDDFSEQIRRRVQQAREAKRRADDEKAKKVMEDVERQNKAEARAKELLDEVPKRMQDAVAASDGSMQFGGPVGAPANIFRLQWLSPPPQRGLDVIVKQLNGTVEWRWFLEGSERARGVGHVNALEFESRKLAELIFALTNQDDWAAGRLP
jgi:hypothetical protein